MSTPKKKPVQKQKIEKSQKLKTPLSMCSRDSSQIIKILSPPSQHLKAKINLPHSEKKNVICPSSPSPQNLIIRS